MKLGSYSLPKEDLKIYKFRDTPLDFCCHQHFFIRDYQLLLYQEQQMWIAFLYKISNFFGLFEFLRSVLIKIVTILMMSEKFVTLGLP